MSVYRSHRLRGVIVQGGRRPPCSGCVVDSSSAQRQWRSLGARSMLDALSFMISTLERSQVGGLFVLIQEGQIQYKISSYIIIYHDAIMMYHCVSSSVL